MIWELVPTVSWGKAHYLRVACKVNVIVLALEYMNNQLITVQNGGKEMRKIIEWLKNNSDTFCIYCIFGWILGIMIAVSGMPWIGSTLGTLSIFLALVLIGNGSDN